MTDQEECTSAELYRASVRAIRQYLTHARECRRADRLERAGAYYVAAAMGNQMRLRPSPENTSIDEPVGVWPTAFGYAVENLFAGALCYRLADAPTQCRRYARRGHDLATELFEAGVFEGAREGLLHEVRGDFRVLGGLDEPDPAYERAAEHYREAETDLGWQMEDDFDAVSRYVVELAHSAEYGLDETTREKITRRSLAARIQYKRAELPGILDAVIADGNWESETL
ncbi:hypothetical protein GRX03_12980 [Halovenus sp. WSH3]|uniref:Uncharacterized protein n=1 Tax=Halovenus carboxidivorans TaxID=2692199 RepID=A0A6B0T6H0_9EURY|nr:hypothetical protein [Halovenus carboxidivorans]MXR52517.1 hypothetical protein [Halovenus carboxidivorans]